MDIARISELLHPFFEDERPSDELLQSVDRYVALLVKWNARINLTAVRDPEHIVTRHFGESFYAARKLVGREDSIEVIDIGSGAGFPGIPVKLLRPGATVRLLEAQARKAAFLAEVVRELRLSGITVVNRRAEDLDERPEEGRAQLVTLRAVEKFTTILPIAAAKVAQNGRLALLIGEEQLTVANQILPGKWEAAARIPLSSKRVVAIWRN